MDTRRLILFVALSLGLMLAWEKFFPQKPNPAQTQSVSATSDIPAVTGASNSNNTVSDGSFNLASDKTITVTTDLMKVDISTMGGDIREIDLLKYSDYDDTSKPYQLLLNQKSRVFIAQTGLISANQDLKLPTHKSQFSADKDSYTLASGQDSVSVTLKADAGNDIVVYKTYTFKRDSYVIDTSYQITNNSANALNNVSAYWRFLRDEQAPSGETKFVHTFTGPVYYTTDAKFNAVKFDSLVKNDVDYPQNVNNGWIGFTEHYFTSLWLLNPYNHPAVCGNGVACRFNLKTVDDGKLASAGLMTDLPPIQAHSSYSVSVPMYVGPQEYKAMALAAPELERTKDYGWVYIFATPLFWLLVHIYEYVKNWGWAIILLTVFVKVVLFPLTRASYKSMAKMKALAPRMEKLKAQYGDDKVKLQQAMMAMYREEKVNPVGGCLPMLLQIPVFIGLYWALLGSVELRQAHFLWISDLSRPDPYYILPVVLAGTMFLQTFLNPPAADPVQAKMMRIMPLAFSVMFFFFPAGLVVYWLVNNVLSMGQQWYVNKHVVTKK